MRDGPGLKDTTVDERRTHALTEHEVARQLGLSVATLRAWRLRHRGPRFVRFGRAVRYLAPDIERFIKANVVEPMPRSASRLRQP